MTAVERGHVVKETHTGPTPGADAQTETVTAAIRAVLGHAPDVVFAYLFGSFVKGRVHAGSDVDVAIWLDSEKPAGRCAAIERASRSRRRWNGRLGGPRR